MAMLKCGLCNSLRLFLWNRPTSWTLTADAFELTAKLGFLLGGFKAKIEAEIGRNLDRLLGA